MKKNLVAASLSVLLCASCKPGQPAEVVSNPETITPAPVAGTAAYVAPVYIELPLGAIKPQGWLLHQLQIMRDGTTGHLDEVYAKVRDDNGWLGGQGDGWEETPYWLDGAVPLAYLLDDKALQEKVLQYINWTLDNQRPSGYFGPITKAERESGAKITADNPELGEDWWPKMIMLKVLKQYYTATGDERVIPFMTRYFNYQQEALKKAPIGNWTEWSESRGHDNVLMAQWLYGITKDKSLLELAALIESQTFPWSTWLGNRDWAINAATQQNDQNWMHRHGVNVAMAIKDPAVNYQRTGDVQYLKALNTGFNDLMTLHGLPYGMFSADEDLHGNNPTQGTELCAIVESMYSLEEIIGITGDQRYMDALERMTFNALPTQTTDDYNNKQYFQIANQVQVKRGVFNFSLPFEREMNNVFGMRSGYTCCLANMHQGWTKFASHLWYATPDKGLAALEYSPNQITAKVGEKQTEVVIDEETSYPFDDVITFHLNTSGDVAFPLQLRIPSWCQQAIVSLNGQQLRSAEGGQIITINRTWQNNDKLALQLPMEVSTSNWGRNSRTVERGPLVYALKLEEKWEKGHDEKEGDYYSVFPKGAWNYGLLQKVVQAPAENLEVRKVKPVTEDFVWNLQHAPIEITAPAKKIPGWKTIENGTAPQPVTARDGLFMGQVDDKVETITLVPYGCTKVRVVAFPVVK
ncbi:glycoside hydrolase family 127 protein [Pontibacter sp. 172403-2]|uniref:beta-L-arabinofuranosidase domain-containing protein n=1 Tax=Pontibacter rufus TaxID=2791028 RepID=UPI0018AFE9B8|nr:beta-L-arabinofuranosidase domain-containing protein [Pontibacter sp. 172403-2]MBF9252862.1 glycoside hydrolase family 127 protein [Pontibacter sp. 172403-2]